MCRRRHHHQPLVVTAGVLAYNEFQKHQQKKRDHALTVDRAMAEASMPSPTSRSSNELVAATPVSNLSEVPADSPPSYDFIDSPVDDKKALETNEQPYRTDIRPIHSSSRTLPVQLSDISIAASYRVYTKVKGGTLRKAHLTAHDSGCTAYVVRCKDKRSSLFVRRACTTVGTAQLLSPDRANLSLDTLGLTSMSRHPRTAAWDVMLPTGDGGMRPFSWKGEVSGAALGSSIWRLEDEDGGVVAVFMDGVKRKCGGKWREGALNVVQSGLSQKMKDAVVTSCFVMLKQNEAS